MTTFTDVFGNSTLPPAEYGFASYSLTTDSTFVWPYNADSAPYAIAKIMDVSCASGNSLILPDSMEVSSGEDFLIRNVGSNTLIVKNSAGTQIATVAIGAASYFYLTDNSTAAGVYGVIGFGVGTSTADASSLVGYGIKAVGASLNQSHPVVPTNTGITLGTDHRAKLVVFTGGVATFNLTSAATLGDDYFTMFRNDGTGTVTIDPASSETLDGMSTMQVQPGESLILICTGTKWYSVGYGRSTLYQFTQLTKDVSAGGTITLSASEAANKLITFIGSPAGAVSVVVPGVVAVYYTQSAISTTQTVTLKTAAGSGVGIQQGARIIALCDGTNVVSAQSAVANTSVSLTDGSSAVPSLFFATQTNTGLYKSGTQDLGVTVNGSTTGVFGSTGLQTSTIGPNSTQRHTLPTVTSDTVTLNAATQTLTNKTLTAPVISTISNTGTLTLPTSTDTLVGRATTDTLTNKTLTAPVISTISNTGTLTLPTSTDTLVGRATTDTLTNKTLTAPVISTISNTGTLTLPTSTDTLVGRATTDTLTNKTIALGNNTVSGTLAQFNTAVTDAELASLAGTETLTNKTISGSNNTLSNIGNASLTNSSITINGNSVSLGGSTTVTATATNALTIGTGLSGTSYNGSTPVTIAIDSTVATLTGTQTLTNKTLTSPSISSPTISDGTANGVTYLNGSKVLTTGSALTFDGSSLGIGIAPTAKLDVSGGSGAIVNVRGTGDAYQEIAGGGRTPGTGSLLVGQGNAGEAYFWNRFNSYTAFGVNNSEAMRLTSTGLGIGTISPLTKLDVQVPLSSGAVADVAHFSQKTGSNPTVGQGARIYLAANSSISRAAAIQAVVASGTTNGHNLQFLTNLDGSTPTVNMTLDLAGNLGIGTSSPSAKLDVQADDTNTIARQIIISGATSSNKRLYIGFNTSTNVGTIQAYEEAFGKRDLVLQPDSGNLGLGVTPSAWQTAYKTFDFGSRGGLATEGTAVQLSLNGYYNAGWKYKQTAAASFYEQYNGTHAWFTAPSGTAGNAISFGDPKMTLDASGNLLVGATSGNQRLVLKGGDTSTAVYLENGATSIGYFGAAKGYNFGFSATDIAVAGYSNNIIFANGSSERARIDSSGNLLVGDTSNIFDASTRLYTKSSGFGALFRTTAASGYSAAAFSRDGYDGAVCQFSRIYNGPTVGSITVNTTSTAYNTTSDHRLKENVRPADAARFMDIEFVDFEWVDGRHDCGVIAHQLQSVYPDLVIGEKDATETRTVEITPAVPEVKDEEGNVVTEAVPAVTEDQEFPVYQQVNYTGLIGRMGTRLQSVIRENEELKTQMASVLERLAALEAP